MKALLALPLLAACATAQILISPYNLSPYSISPWSLPYATNALPYATIAAPTVTATQFRAQDELGQFSFGTTGDNQARSEVKTLDGTVRGAYSYVDPTGKLISVNYIADDNGFRVTGANNLPEANLEAPVANLKGPEPVQDTAEVVAAKAQFRKLFDEAAAAADAAPDTVSRKKRQILVSPFSIPTLAKTTVKVQQFEPVDAKTPADTQKIELKEKEQEIITSLAPIPYSLGIGPSTIAIQNPAVRTVQLSPLGLGHSFIL